MPSQHPTTAISRAAESRWLSEKQYWLLLFAIVLGFGLIRFPFVLDWFGEQDSVRLVLPVLKETKLSFPMHYGAIHSSPLYLQLIRLLHGMGAPWQTFWVVLNWINFFVSMLVLFPVAAIARKFGGQFVALATILLIQFMPSFWLGSIYGFPNMIGYLFLLGAILNCIHMFPLDQQSTQQEHRILVRRWFGMTLCVAIAVGMKVDLLLTFAVFPAVLWFSGVRNIRYYFLVIFLLILAVLGTILGPGIYEWWHHTSPIPDGVRFAKDWTDKFPFRISALFDYRNSKAIVTAFGPIFSLLAFLGWFELVRKKEKRKEVLILAAWAVPLILFWGFIYGNSARHNMAAAMPVALVIALLLRQCGNMRLRISLLLVIIVSNYFSLSPNSNTVRPSTRLLTSSRQINQRVLGYRNRATKMLSCQGSKIAIIDSWARPLVLYSLIVNADSGKWIGDELFELTDKDGQTRTYTSYYAAVQTKAKFLAVSLKRQGWSVCSMKYKLGS